MASVIQVTADGFPALVAAARGQDADAEVRELARELGPALDAVVAPRTVIDLERREEHATCWVGGDAACLLVPERPGWFRAFAFAPDELPVALLRAVGATESARPHGDVVRYEAAELAGLLARGQLDGFRAHWRASAGAASVEVIETSDGSWAVVPDGSHVELHPIDATWIYAAIVDLVATERTYA